MNGAPIPADPTGPPHILVALGAVFVALILVFAWLLVAERIHQRKQRLQDKQETLAQAIAQEKAEYEDLKLQTLINQSPGGRKPWQ